MWFHIQSCIYAHTYMYAHTYICMILVVQFSCVNNSLNTDQQAFVLH